MASLDIARFRCSVDNDMSFMLACLEFLAAKRWGRASCGNRDATLELFEARCREDKYKPDVLVSGVLQADPGLRRNEDNRSCMTIAFFTSEPHMSRTGLDQEDFVLSDVFVPCNLPAGRDVLRSQNHITRATVFRIYFDRELRGRHWRLARPSDAVFAIVLLENEGLCCRVSRELCRCLREIPVASKKRDNNT